MKKIDIVKHLMKLVENVDEKAFLASEHRMYMIVNKKKLLSLTPEQLAKRSSIEGLDYMITLYTKYQLGGK